mmetsp:Transcript_60333/g.186784  ORF Transcript_60333/g.186784 Transcript_60333/m.186784 type:complete len:266 (-) Transcript_60333:215-1012(-)
MAPLLRSLIFAAALASARAGPDAGDATVLVQASTHMKAGSDNCECMNFQEVYGYHRMRCGAIGELNFSGMPPEAAAHFYADFCSNFLRRFNQSVCIQQYPRTDRSEAWCWTSWACENTNGGNRHKHLQWKVCTPGKDPYFKDRSPEELFAMSQADNMDPSLLMRYAYPVYQTAAWPEALNCLQEMKNETIMNDPECVSVRKVLDEKKPVMFDSLDMKPPFGVFIGGRAIEARLSQQRIAKVRSEEEFKSVPREMVEYKCMFGCDE